MFDIIDVQNLFTITEITDKFLLISDIQNLLTLNEVNNDGN